jgi:GT2 family glycosyltransferase/glycosyltransferase involved in cell wall biosynthesis
MPVSPQSPIAAANHALRGWNFAAAMAGYVAAMQQMPELGQTLAGNLAHTRRKYLASRRTAAKPQVVVCGWELAHNAAGRAYTLAQIYQEFADVELIGCLFPNWGREIWEPLRGATNVNAIPIHPILVEDSTRIINHALTLVAAHPAEIVHLSKPRGPNILFGILYKLLWGARVILDIDDEELAFVQAETPLAITDYLAQHSALPPLDKITQADWTRLSVGLTDAFDAITVANSALQQRYGGQMIGHARDPQHLTPSPALRQASRQALGIRPEQKVVLFSGTPRPHKGLLEVARAIQSLNRPDILFVIAGSFGKNHLDFKAQLQAIAGVHYLFLEDQPLAALPRTLATADCCVLLQDPHNLCATYQTPAKLSDALAMRIPAIATATPALAEPIAAGAILVATPDNLARQIATTLDQPNAAQIETGHRYFTEHLSLTANAKRLQHLIANTQTGALSPALWSLLPALPQSAPHLRHLLAQQSAPTGKLAIAVHVYYPELWPEIAERLRALNALQPDTPFFLDITTPPDQAALVERAVQQDFPAARIHITPNRGMDILPFLSLVPRWQQEGILAVCKLHTKKGDGGQIATHWRKHLLDTLVGHPNTLKQIARAFAEHPRLSLVGPAILYLSGQRLLYENEAALQQISQALNQGPLPETDWGFFAGTMFWSRPAALAPLAALAANQASALSSAYAKDGQYEHALERAFGLIPHHQAGQIGLFHPPPTPAEAPALEIATAADPATRQLINPSHASQAVRQTFSLVDWAAECQKPRVEDKASIIIPIYNQPELTAACVASLYQHTDVNTFELILVDNGSDAPTQILSQSLADRHANLRLIRNPENLNFAHGCNIGFAASQGKFVVFLNNDTTVTPHWLPPLVQALRQPGVAAVQPKLLYPDGTIQCIGVVFSARSPLGYPIYAGKKPEAPWAHRSRAFQSVTGACMVLRASDFAELQGFDPIYINGQEDIDLCLRLSARRQNPCGWVVTESTVFHHESKTPNRFHHVAYNRGTFVRRWAGRVKADDQRYYAADGFSVGRYQPDSPHTLPAQSQVYRPQIALAARQSRPASADFYHPALEISL